MEACAGGVPVFCEKPVAGTVAATVEVLRACAGHRVQIGFQRRFDPGYVAGRRAVRGGEAGRAAPGAPGHGRSRAAARRVPAVVGGIFRDCHIHDFDILRWVTGREVVSVFARGANRGAAFFREAGDVDNSAALLTLDDGTLATLQGSRYNGGGYDVRMELAGTRRTQAVGLGPHAPCTPPRTCPAWASPGRTSSPASRPPTGRRSTAS